MLDLNNNGKLDPEEEALEDILAEEAAVKDPEREESIPWLMIGAGIFVVVVIVALLAFVI